MSDLVFIGDVHLEAGDPQLDAFVTFLHAVGRSSSRVVLMGDLFNLWIGRRELEQPHQTPVLDALRDLRQRGVVVRYLEGNRDYRIGPAYEGSCVDEATAEPIVEEFGGRRLIAVHGDLANPADLQYRTWRRVSRAAPVWGLFNLMPRSLRLRLAENVEARLRRSNRRFKKAFPETVVRAYATRLLASGADAVVLGHFHTEHDLRLDDRRRVLVLPEWKQGRRYLRVAADGDVRFVDSPV